MNMGREERAFEAFVSNSSGRLLRTAYLLCGDRGHAEDLVQTALFRTARRWSRARDQPEAYARRVLTNLTKDRWRSLGRRPAEQALADPPSGAPSDAQEDAILERDRLLGALRALPAQQRAVVVLRFLDGLTVAETAAALECSEGTVKSQTSRALGRIRSVLDRDKEMENTDADR
jgi:RNA polymerase sigma-70 factor (sigma-E family)